MRHFQTSVLVARSLDAVMAAYWRAESWPEFTPHVRRIDIHFEDEDVQVLAMHVDTRGKRDVFKSVRIRQGCAIHYFQPTPPPTLRFHQGRWEFSHAGNDTLVTCHHSMIVDPDGCRNFFAMVGIDLAGQDPADRLQEIICNNSNQTMAGIKGRLENARKHEEALAS